MHDYVKNLAKVVRAAREEAHLSQAALAEQIGCDERTILNIENDRGNPKFEVLCQIIAYLHIPADRIFHPDTATDGLINSFDKYIDLYKMYIRNVILYLQPLLFVLSYTYKD